MGDSLCTSSGEQAKMIKFVLFISAATSCPTGWESYNGYLYCSPTPTTQMSWSEANTACVNLGAELASIHSEPEGQFVWSLGYNGYNPWTGGYWSDNGWRWTDETPWDYNQWWSGDGAGDGGKCASVAKEVKRGGIFSERKCDRARSFVEILKLYDKNDDNTMLAH